MLEKKRGYCVPFEHKKIMKLKVIKIMDFELRLKIFISEYTSDESHKNEETNLSRIDEINIKLYETQVVHERIKISLMGLRKNRAWIDVVKTSQISTN